MRKPTEKVSDKEDFKKSNNNRKGKRPNKGKRRFPTEKESIDKSTNDPSWYSQSAELLRDSSSIPFSWPVGTPMRTSGKMGLDVVPGVCSLKLAPTVGTSTNVNSPINVASSAIYSWVRHANSGHANYEAPDLMLYLLAMSNIYSYIVWMQRIYGYVSLYDQRNRYLPRALAAADGVDFDSIRDNLADYRYFLNTYISKAASLAVPATMPIFARLAFLYANVYCEGPSVKDQMYMYSPFNLAWYKFGINGTTSVGELTLTTMPKAGTYATFAEIKNFALNLFDAIWDQEDFGIMSGDILKAYDGNIIKLSPIPEEMSFTPLYDAMVLHQMKNAKVASEIGINPITQTNGIITHSIVLSAGATALGKNIMLEDFNRDKVLSTDFDNPGPEVVIESTRLMYGYDSVLQTISTGTELCTGVQYWYYTDAGVLQSIMDSNITDIYDTTDPRTAAGTAGLVANISIMSNFKYRPEKIFWGYHGTTITNNAAYRYWDIDNYAVLSNNDLAKMHETALLSLFAVPAIAKIS